MSGITQLTEVQSRCLEPGIAGKDIIAKSNTGSGKALAFLLVAVERIVRHGGPDPVTSFPVVILLPVTDLAMQMTKVADFFLAYHRPMKADVVIGGTDEKRDIRRLTNDRIDILVATPGRLKSILKQSEAIRSRLSRCQTFVIDEVDKLTDPGFLRDIKWIHETAYNSRMQTLAFSATMDKNTLMATGLLRRDAEFIDVAPQDKPQVNTKVRQSIIVTDFENHLDVVANIVFDQMYIYKKHGKTQSGGSPNVIASLTSGTRRALSEWEMPSMSGFRIMVFLPSNAFIDYFAAAFEYEVNAKTYVLHGGLAQGKRTKSSDAFRSTDNCILFTSDASARGVDYPDVTCVIQLGYDSRAEYLQRVGRTGRAGKSGSAFLVIAPQEVPAASQVCDVIHDIYSEYPATKLCTKAHGYRSTGILFPDMPRAAKAGFRGWLGSLASKWKRLKMSKHDTLDMAQSMHVALGLGHANEDNLREKLHIK